MANTLSSTHSAPTCSHISSPSFSSSPAFSELFRLWSLLEVAGPGFSYPLGLTTSKRSPPSHKVSCRIRRELS
jgi:hypothetical protein